MNIYNERIEMMRRIFLIITVMVGFVFCSFANTAQSVDPPNSKSIFDLVTYKDINEVTLEVDLNDLLSDRRNEESFKGTFSFQDENGNEQVFNTKVNIRGKYRRTNCSEMPPLKLNFKKSELTEKGLTKHDDFKLVTQCVEDEAKAKELLLREYLAYKMYNELTDHSFRVQFLKINFKDNVTGEVKKQYGFIIEDNAQLRARLSLEKYEGLFGIPKDKMEKAAERRVALFQYMIGNLDWGIYEKVHNVKLAGKEDQIIPIPYDFDFSSLVRAPYATVNPKYKMKTFEDRFYLGNPENMEEMNSTISLFKSKRKAIIDLVKNCKELKMETRYEMIDYINSFYKNIDNISLPEEKNSTKLSSKR